MANSTMNWPSPGLGHAPSYQVSGIPFVTSSTALSSQAVVAINFPYVTRWVHVRNLDQTAHLRLGFSSNGLNNGYYILLQDFNKANSEITLDVKCSSIYVMSNTAANINFSVAAGLTSIPTSELANTGPSGNNWSGSSGVG